MSSPPFTFMRRSQSGAFDLPSVLIGVAVVAILAIGVMAAIFGVIPWAQDRAAKQDLAAMNTAQGTVYARDGSFADKAALVGAGWLGEGTPDALDAKADVEGKCYVAVTTSKTGNQFVVSHNKPAPRELTAADTWCNGSRIMKDTSPVMITTWDTSLAANCKEITLPVSNDFKGTVTWGDGTKDAATTHTFAASGPVTIRIDGTFSAWGSELWADRSCLVSVDRWGETGTTKLQYAFQWAENLKHVESIPTTTTSLYGAFWGNPSDFTLGPLDTSQVTVMTNMFRATTDFNQPVNFDTSRVTDLDGMFYGAKSFNQPVNFDTSNVTAMWDMFNGAKAFNQPVHFNAPKSTSTSSMFANATAFNQPVTLTGSSLVNSTYGMFDAATSFNQILTMDTSGVETMREMFDGAFAFNQPLSFNTSRVTDMQEMFYNCSKFNQPLNFDTSKVTNMRAMFLNNRKFNQDLSAWDVSKVTLASRDQFDSSTTSWTLPKPNWVH